MSSIRLFILGELARKGPMHGHQIRRAAQLDHIDVWTDVKPGSLYGGLRRMTAEGLVQQVRTERPGGHPERTVYEITQEGRHELEIHRSAALRDARLRPDPVDLALTHAQDMAADSVLAAVQERRDSLEHQRQSQLRLRDQAEPYLTDLERLIFDHSLRRLGAELDWHDQLLSHLPKVLATGDQEANDGSRHG
ncbi:PadR family transcriptional regulator [Nonomuraea sp. 3N208]|uniref:PadR family transcriptional regulator n=1 Tax=Nonomuraea sp. 3N208 TaxID=3457421 RepID=UPI003FD5D62F